MDPSSFYTGLVADLYGQLREVTFGPEPYARFIAISGEPALELGCGDGVPLLQLRAQGIDVEGLDSSEDMLDRCRVAAARQDVDVVLHHQRMESMDIPRRYRTVFLAGATFNLLPDDDRAASALARIRDHLEPSGSALVPLFIPKAISNSDLGAVREVKDPTGSILRVAAVAQERDEDARTQTTVLRYERIEDDGTASVIERPWVLHWHTQRAFRELVTSSGLTTTAVLNADGTPATDDAETFAFWLTKPE